MNLYEINQEVLNLVDMETGEIEDFERFEQLSMERNSKIENIALWIKNLNAESAALKAEKLAFDEREKQASAKAESLRGYLERILCGETFKTPKVNLTYRKSVQTVVDDGFVEWAKTNKPELLSMNEPAANKTAIKNAISSGECFEFAHLEERQNLQIK